VPDPLIIDTDPAIGIPFRDVDDALAILYALARPDDFEILAITPVHGNAPLRRTVPKAREILAAACMDEVPVFPGAASARDLGTPTAASDFLVEQVRTRPGVVTVLAIGPLTNVATAGITDRDFYKDVRRLVIMGGALQAGLGIPALSPLEFNFFKDARAAESVLAAPCEKVIITMDLCTQVVFTRRELTALEGMRNPVSGYLARHIRPWLRLNQVAPFLPWTGGFVPWDVIAAIYLRRPELFEEEEACLRLRGGRMKTGALEKCEDGTRPCRLPVRVRAPELLDEFLGTIHAHPWGQAPGVQLP
jgi:purine nucleosidase